MAYTGNKDGRTLPAPPKGRYNVIYDLFAGGMGYSRAARKIAPRAKIVCAEANVLQRTIIELQAGFNPELKAQVEEHCWEVAEALKRSLNPAWDGKGTYGTLFPEDRDVLKAVWDQEVKAPFDAVFFGGPVTVAAIAAQMLNCQYGFYSAVRTSGKGLNIPPSAQKVLTHDAPTLSPLKGITKVYGDYKDVVIDKRRAIVVIDPPYALTKNMQETHSKLTACYKGHDPYSDATFDLYWGSVSMAVQAMVDCVVVAGYMCPRLDGGIHSLASHYGYEVEVVDYGPCKNQNKYKNIKHGGRSEKPRGAYCAAMFAALWHGCNAGLTREMLDFVVTIDVAKLKPRDTEWILRRRMPLAGAQIELGMVA